MRQAINFDLLKVQITFPNGEVQVLSFREVQEYALNAKDLNLCADLINKGSTVKGSLLFTLIN